MCVCLFSGGDFYMGCSFSFPFIYLFFNFMSDFFPTASKSGGSITLAWSRCWTWQMIQNSSSPSSPLSERLHSHLYAPCCSHLWPQHVSLSAQLRCTIPVVPVLGPPIIPVVGSFLLGELSIKSTRTSESKLLWIVWQADIPTRWDWNGKNSLSAMT